MTLRRDSHANVDGLPQLCTPFFDDRADPGPWELFTTIWHDSRIARARTP